MKYTQLTKDNFREWMAIVTEEGMSAEEAGYRKWEVLAALLPMKDSSCSPDKRFYDIFHGTGCALCEKYQDKDPDYDEGTWRDHDHWKCGPCPLAEGFSTADDEEEKFDDDCGELSEACCDPAHMFNYARYHWEARNTASYTAAAEALRDRLLKVWDWSVRNGD